MKASPLIVAMVLTFTSAQAFPGGAGPHPGGQGIVHALGRYGGDALVPDVPPPVEPPSAPSDVQSAVETPRFAPAVPQPYYLPAARPRRPKPHILYVGKPLKGDGPRIVYGTD